MEAKANRRWRGCASGSVARKDIGMRIMSRCQRQDVREQGRPQGSPPIHPSTPALTKNVSPPIVVIVKVGVDGWRPLRSPLSLIRVRLWMTHRQNTYFLARMKGVL